MPTILSYGLHNFTVESYVYHVAMETTLCELMWDLSFRRRDFEFIGTFKYNEEFLIVAS